MVKRISPSYKEGTSAGDLGYSNLMTGDYVSKGTSFAATYSSVEWLQHGLQKYVFDDEGRYTFLAQQQLEQDDIEFLEWLYESLFALSSFCYRKGNTEEKYNLMFPEAAYQWMLQRIDYLKNHDLESNTEFISLRGTLNKLRIQVRDVERHFVSWFNEPVIIKEYRTNPSVYDNIIRQQRFLNRLSTYFYWLSRHATLKSGGTHKEWITQVPVFTL